MVASWSLTQEMASLSPFTVMTNIFRKFSGTFRKNSIEPQVFDANVQNNTGADPGFPRGANLKGEAQTYYLATFSQKVHEHEEHWTKGGAHV